MCPKIRDYYLVVVVEGLCSLNDDGRTIRGGFQEQPLNHLGLLWLSVKVVSTQGKGTVPGFNFKGLRTKTKKWRVNYQPKMQARVKVMEKIRGVFKHHESQPLTRVRDLINPILKDWVQYFRIGNSSKVFGYVKDWLTRKIRRHLMRAKWNRGFGWTQWSTKGLYACIIYMAILKYPRGK